MQHFPRIAEPFNPIRVPYGGGRYRGGNFETYLKDQDPPLDLKRLHVHDLGHHSQAYAAQVLQAWLYFGLLTEAMQLDVAEEDFIEVSWDDNIERKFITTERLRDYIHRWRAAHENAKADPYELAERKRKTIEALSASHRAWSGFTDFTAVVGAEVELSIQLLACAIEHAVTSVYGASPDSDGETWIHVNQAPWRRTQSPFVEERMRRMGWCPSVIRQLGSPYKLSLQTFVSLLKPSFGTDPAVHESCEYGDISCQWKNIDEKTYVTKHVDGCMCTIREPEAFLQVDKDQLRKILEDGGIPIVHLDTSERSSQCQLKVVKYRHELQYTAISHVWADGLGNPRANALPLCQLKRIIKILADASDSWMPVSKTPPTQYFDSVWKHDIIAKDNSVFTAEELNSAPLYFWMDTLCVPPHDKALRKAAIKNMRTVYSRANRVFVLDADLLATPGNRTSLSDQEFLARITASSWARRYWTLQEALLAKNLLFQFAEEAIRIIDPPDQNENVYLHFYDNDIGYYANNDDFMLRRRASTYSEHDKVESIWSSLGGRSTSHRADELICVATLLDMDLGKLLELDEQDRMAQLWKMYTELPLGFLCRPAEKLEDPAVPWAFANISDCTTLIAPRVVTATQHSGVLRFAHHGFFVPEQLQHTPNSIIAVKIDTEVYFVRQNLRSNNKSWSGIDFTSAGARFAIVLGQNHPAPIEACLGALIQVRTEDVDRMQSNGALKGRYLRAVSVVKKESSWDVGTPVPGPDTVDREIIYSGTWIPPQQEWVIHGSTSEV